MADRSITLKIGANVTGALNGLKTLARATEDANNRALDYVGRNEQHINELSNGFAVAGAAATGFALLAVKKFADFDSAMSSVESSGEDAANSIGALREAAIDAGADTVFSATEAAGAIENLAKAGVSAKDILAGGLKGSLDLAAAGSMDVGEAAEYASIAMTQFKLGGKDVGHVADLLAAGAGKAMGEVSDLGQALKQGGLVASQTGLTIEETTGTLSAFAAAGLLGSDAGTSLKTMLQRLSAPTADVQGLMDELKISAYDASGEFVGMTEFAAQLTRALGDMTPAQRNAALATIFGADAVRAAAVVYENGESGIRDWITAVDDQGYAAETARTKLDNLKGDVEALGGSLETVFIQSGSGVNDGLRSIVQGADAVIDKVGEIPAPVLGATTAIVGSGGLVLLSIAGMGKMAIAINDAKMAYEGLGRSAKVASISAGAVGIAVAAATVGFAHWAQKAAEARASTDAWKATLDSFGDTTESTMSRINDILSQDRDTWIPDFLESADSYIQTAEKMGLKTQDLQGYLLGEADAVDAVNTAYEAYEQRGKEGRISGRDADAAMKMLSGLELEAENLARSTTELERKAEASKAAGETTAGLASATAEHAATLEQQAQASKKWIEDTAGVHGSFVDLGGAYQGVIDKNTEYAVSTADATQVSSDSWEDYYDGVSVSSADYIGQLQAQVQAQESWAANMTALSSRVNTTMTGDMRTAANNMIDELLDLGPGGAAQVQMLHDMSDAELQQVVELYQRKGRASGDEFADEIASTRPGAIPVTADTSSAQTRVDDFIATMSKRTIKMGISAATIVGNPAYGFHSANGNVVDYFANGSENHVAQIAPAGSWRVWAEPETGGEAYIPLTSAKRGRSTSILKNVANRFGYDLAPKNSPAMAVHSAQFAYTPPAQTPAAAPSLDLAGLQLVGTLDLGNGLEARMEAVAVGVVDAQGRSDAGARRTVGRTR